MNLDQYIQDLTKEAAVDAKLEKHLTGLVKKASEEAELEQKLANASAEELAKMAGIELPEGTCPKCANPMQKLGSVYQCTCGMVKKAACPGGKIRSKGRGQGLGRGGKKGPMGVPVKTKTASVKVASLEKFAEAYRMANGDVDRAVDILVANGYEELEKDAFGFGQAVQAVKNWGQLGKHLVKSKAKDVAQTYSKARGLSGVGTYGPQMAGGKGIGGALIETAKKHPGVATGVVGAPVAAGAGYMMGKSGSARALIEVGDAAGRTMAKTALMIEPSEVTEAIEGAQEREDIPGRAKRWGRAGAGLGAVGGGALGAGAGLGGMLLAKKLGLNVPSNAIQKAIIGGGGGAGAIGGGVLGHRIGQQEGAEEAAADKLVSMIRGRRAYLAGGARGYGAGLQRGFMAGRGAGNPQ